jgi:hypothetical protein
MVSEYTIMTNIQKMDIQFLYETVYLNWVDSRRMHSFVLVQFAKAEEASHYLPIVPQFHETDLSVPETPGA